MSNQRVVNFAFEAAIPVGHRVELRLFSREVGVFSKKLEPHVDQPLVTDLDSGVVYGAGWHFEPISMYVSGQSRPLPLEVRSDIPEVARLAGRVVACRIARIGNTDSAFTQTTLVIEELPPDQVYR